MKHTLETQREECKRFKQHETKYVKVYLGEGKFQHNGMRFFTVVGTRPEILRLCDWEQEVIFTGQHTDYLMAQKFLTEFSNTNVKRLKHVCHVDFANVDESNLVSIAAGIAEKIRVIGKPDIIIVHGDTRSAFAGAMVANEQRIILAHTEAGVRSSEETIEQQYRKKIDALANYNFCPIPQAVKNLEKEGITEGVYYVGDTLYDKFLQQRINYRMVFVTIHRRENIENEKRLRSIIERLGQYEDRKIIFPVHPHTRVWLNKFGIELPRNVVVLLPLDHKKTLTFIKDAELVITDSGGIQREAYWSGTPCEVVREDSEWNVCTNAFGNGHAGDKILMILESKKPYRRLYA